jgi:hypothetical protein
MKSLMLLVSYGVLYVTFSVEGGELFDRVIAAGRLSEPVSKLLFYQMVLGVKVRIPGNSCVHLLCFRNLC